ncbi:NAD-dependent epimerase/dehydratase family protein [Gryllotalpicola reticulitermitis]|uniref:NAD-dependent epimerase/dehydratase family protein n=1 Tax=Gryllotalpicola reticulitermitis TaxID=1184153 RepID=A0ABV8Q4Q2_9MICO
MKYLVTGAAGFVGSNLCTRLLSDAANTVVGVDAFRDYYDPALKERNVRGLLAQPNFSLVRGDICSLNLDELLQGVDVVFHEAGQPGVRSSWGNSFSTYTHDNIEATQLLLEAVTRMDRALSRFVYASSSSVYGDAERYPTDESDRPGPKSPYGVTKLAAEHLCSLYAQAYSVPVVSLRYFTVYGPGQRPDMAFTKFLTAATEGTEIQIYGDGSQVREFTFISDIVEANIRSSYMDVPAGCVINLSGGSAVSVKEVIDEIRSMVERDLRVSFGAPVVGDVYRTGGSTERARKYLEWEPQVDIASGLRLQYGWVREARGI